MAVFNNRIFSNRSYGASVLEVLLAMAIVAIATPFIYGQVAKTNHSIHDIAVARRIMSVRDNVLNFVRMNQDTWPDNAQIRLDAEELTAITPDSVAGFVDKYMVNGATVTDVYLAFDIPDTDLRTANIARHIGTDAAVVSSDSVAYGDTWAVAAPDFQAGDLIYRVSRDVAGQDTSRYLHRGTSGEDNLNMMMRDLDMARHHIYNVATLDAKSVTIKNANAAFVSADDISANNVYFSSGANMDGQGVSFGSLRVTGDMSGFRNMYADNLNGRGYTTSGRIITDRATITGTINVSGNLVLKSDTTRTISGFTGINVNSVLVPYISAQEMFFYENFGLTVSGELLMSTTAPIKFGNWTFPSTKPPVFTSFKLSRASAPVAPSRGEFDMLIQDGWQETILTPITPEMATN